MARNVWADAADHAEMLANTFDFESRKQSDPIRQEHYVGAAKALRAVATIYRTNARLDDPDPTPVVRSEWRDE